MNRSRRSPVGLFSRLRHACRFSTGHGARRGPSAWPARTAFLSLACLALGVATYLGLYQLRVVDTVWEPLFGDGSRHSLRESGVSDVLPLPDALFGAVAYLTEAVLVLIGDSVRWRTLPGVVLLEAGLAAALGMVGVALTISQVFVFHAGCTLCLVTATCSWLMAALVGRESLTACRRVMRARHAGHSWRRALYHPQADPAWRHA